MLSELTPQACDAVLSVTGSAERLAELERSSSFVVALDDHRRSYRYHRLLAELLRAELERSDPRLARECLSRAAVWYDQEAARPGEAFRCARACEDFELAGRVALASVDGFASRGRLETLRRWLSGCSEEQIESAPSLALAAASVCMRMGELEKAQRYGAAAGAANAETTNEVLTFRSALAPRGVRQMLSDGELVCEARRTASARCRLEGALAVGTAHLLLGRPGVAADTLRASLVLSRGRPDLAHVRIQCLGYLAFAAARTDDWSIARKAAQEAAALSAEAGLDDALPGGIALTARALVLAHDGHLERAGAELARARRVRNLFGGTRWMQADINIHWGNLSLDTGDRLAAQEHIDVARAALAGYEDPGMLVCRLEDLERRRCSLTDLHITRAEVRVLPFLPTHLSIKEIAAQLFVSPATVKTHVSSVYAKLDASTRSEAVARMHELGLHLGGSRLEHDPGMDGAPLLAGGHRG